MCQPLRRCCRLATQLFQSRCSSNFRALFAPLSLNCIHTMAVKNRHIISSFIYLYLNYSNSKVKQWTQRWSSSVGSILKYLVSQQTYPKLDWKCPGHLVNVVAVAVRVTPLLRCQTFLHLTRIAFRWRYLLIYYKREWHKALTFYMLNENICGLGGGCQCWEAINRNTLSGWSSQPTTIVSLACKR